MQFTLIFPQPLRKQLKQIFSSPKVVPCNKEGFPVPYEGECVVAEGGHKLAAPCSAQPLFSRTDELV